MLPQKRELPRFPRPSATSQASFPPISGQKKCGWTPLTCLQDGVNEDAGLPRQGRPTKNLRVFKGSNRFGCPTSRTSTRNNMCVFPRNLNILFSMFKHPINHVFISMAISATSNDERFVHLGRSCLLLAGRPHFQGLLLRQTSGISNFRSSCARIFCCPPKLRSSASYQVSTMFFVPNIGVGFFLPKKIWLFNPKLGEPPAIYWAKRQSMPKHSQAAPGCPIWPGGCKKKHATWKSSEVFHGRLNRLNPQCEKLGLPLFSSASGKTDIYGVWKRGE